jgi:hypothetical protein
MVMVNPDICLESQFEFSCMILKETCWTVNTGSHREYFVMALSETNLYDRFCVSEI